MVFGSLSRPRPPRRSARVESPIDADGGADQQDSVGRARVHRDVRESLEVRVEEVLRDLHPGALRGRTRAFEHAGIRCRERDVVVPWVEDDVANLVGALDPLRGPRKRAAADVALRHLHPHDVAPRSGIGDLPPIDAVLLTAVRKRGERAVERDRNGRQVVAALVEGVRRGSGIGSDRASRSTLQDRGAPDGPCRRRSDRRSAGGRSASPVRRVSPSSAAPQARTRATRTRRGRSSPRA